MIKFLNKLNNILLYFVGNKPLRLLGPPIFEKKISPIFHNLGP